MCKKYGATEISFFWTGIKRYGREWVKADGSVLDSNIRIDWVSGYPNSRSRSDYLSISCYENINNHFGRFVNVPESDGYKYICQ